ALFAALVILGLVSQAVGHRLFERNNPSLLDHPAHLFLGPMFVMAKLYMALGFRPSVADLVAPSWSSDRLGSDPLQGDQHSRP
ncbi:MAG: Mpo1-like protein, partial [Bradyrhizobium sp.]|nr:Mpo1-like protein [Bradyrhizobium sp.]